MIYSILPPKAEEGWIKPDQCQVNSTWIELTYYIETLIWHTLNKTAVPSNKIYALFLKEIVYVVLTFSKIQEAQLRS